MLYFLAIIAPPFAVAATGRPFLALLNVPLTIAGLAARACCTPCWSCTITRPTSAPSAMACATRPALAVDKRANRRRSARKVLTPQQPLGSVLGRARAAGSASSPAARAAACASGPAARRQPPPASSARPRRGPARPTRRTARATAAARGCAATRGSTLGASRLPSRAAGSGLIPRRSSKALEPSSTCGARGNEWITPLAGSMNTTSSPSSSKPCSASASARVDLPAPDFAGSSSVRSPRTSAAACQWMNRRSARAAMPTMRHSRCCATPRSVLRMTRPLAVATDLPARGAGDGLELDGVCGRLRGCELRADAFEEARRSSRSAPRPGNRCARPDSAAQRLRPWPEGLPPR